MNNRQITDSLRQIGLQNLAVSIITVAELYYGAIDNAELRKIKKHLALLHQIPLTRDVSLRFLELMQNYALSHRPGIPDALIAATALDHDLPLYTLNTKDFRFIPDLQLHDQSARS